MERNFNLIDGIDFVICKICNFHAQNLGAHLTRIHNISSKEYIKKYNGVIISKKSYEKYKLNGNGELLSNYIKNNLEEFCKKVSEGILNSPESRKIHSEMMIKLNNVQQNDPMFKKLVSETAIRTSARPDIQEQRSKNLKKWRDENPEEFYDKCIQKMITSFQSKPEKKLFEFVSSLDGFSFRRNRFIHSQFITNKSHKKQMDMGDKEKRIYIEFDGVLHFQPKHGDEVLTRTKQRDIEIERHISNHNWTLIRISYDQFKYTTKTINKVKEDASYFKQECLTELVKILDNNIPGIYKIGEVYGKH
jgi:hypothetical protein